MPARSQHQQRFMSLVHLAQTGRLKSPSPQVQQVASSIDPESAKHFAATKHKGLPEKVPVKKPAAKAAQVCPQVSQFYLPQRNAAMHSKEAMAKLATTRMVEFVNYLANKVPAGKTAAQFSGNQATYGRLLKLASEIGKDGNLFRAVDETYSDKNAAYRYQVVGGLISGLVEHLKQASGMMGGCPGGMKPAGSPPVAGVPGGQAAPPAAPKLPSPASMGAVVSKTAMSPPGMGMAMPNTRELGSAYGMGAGPKAPMPAAPKPALPAPAPAPMTAGMGRGMAANMAAGRPM